MDSHNIALIGRKFMGRAHMQAYHSMPLFFPLRKRPLIKVLCGRGDDVRDTAAKFFIDEWDTDYRNAVGRSDIEIVDICATDDVHRDIAILAAASGKHIFCEKPLARTLDETREMTEAVRKYNVVNMVNFVYRAVPAIRLAKHLISKGMIGEIYHFNCFYKQDFCLDKSVPFGWRMDAEQAGGGTMADKGSHMIDLGRYLAGEFAEVCSRSKVYVPYRKLPDSDEVRKVTSNDASVFIAEFVNGAVGVFQASNIAAGEKNALIVEIYGSLGSMRFNLERFNEIEIYNAGDDPQGFRTVIATGENHPYIDHWWPEGHIIGWQNLFVHQVYEFLSAVESGSQAAPDFMEGLRCQAVVDALIRSDKEKRWANVEQV
jgi:predicted dehydrogenase